MTTLTRHRSWISYRPASGLGQGDEAFDHFVEQRGLLEIEHMARFRKYRQTSRRKMFLQEQAGLDAIVVLVAADDQGWRRDFLNGVGQRVDRGPAALKAAHGVGGALALG